MTSSIADIVAQLKTAREQLAAAAATLIRAEADAEQARQWYAEAASGTDHPQMKEAITDIRTAGEKAARTARLLTEARAHFTAYSNRIAPGSASDDDVQDAEMPSGERLLDEAGRRGRKADIIWRKQMQKAEDTESTLRQIEDAGKAVLKYFRQQHGPSGTTTSGTAPPKQPQSQERPQVDNPVTAAIMATGAVAIAAKSVWNSARKQREKKRNDDQT